ncbi:MAG TPA: 50S ribosomal protein L15 [Armatimonadota bacterium]|jgi:large subunit ribosomal protein L15
MKLNELSPGKGAKKDRMRIGRGTSSGKGRTAGRGDKGQKKYANVSPWFEGGQTPLHRRLPKKRGFNNKWKVEFEVVNLAALEERFEAGATIEVSTLVESGLVRDGQPVKVLGEGDLTKAFTVKANAFSKSAIEKLSAAGGAAEVI